MTQDELNLIEAMACTAQAAQALRRLDRKGQSPRDPLIHRADQLTREITAAWEETRVRIDAEPPVDYPPLDDGSAQSDAWS